MGKPNARYCFSLVLAALLLAGCNAYQPTKNVWKTTKGLWYTYMSPPASVDYDEKGTLSPQALALTHSMMGIDVELTRLERTMLNADKPPTREWLSSFLTSFPWINGFAGVKYDGTILGQEPASPMKQLDYIPLLYEDKKQSSRALRADVQNTPLGPEVLIAAPLYDGTDFLGVVAANFDMRSLMQYSKTPQDVVILSPQALLWPGKYDFAATPLAGVDWEQTVVKSTAGTCTNANGTFYYNVRFLGNLPLVFAVAESGTFPEGNGDVAQGLAFFPKERPQLPPPPHEERKQRPNFAQGLNVEPAPAPEAAAAAAAAHDAAASAPAQTTKASGRTSGTDIQPGSRDSMLLRRKQAERRPRVQERQLEGENITIDHTPRPRPSRPEKPLPPPTGLGLDKDMDSPTLPGGRPSPFGPRDESAAGSAAPQSNDAQPAAEKPAEHGAAATDAGTAGDKPAETPASSAPAADEKPAASGNAAASAPEPASGAAGASQEAGTSAGQEGAASAPAPAEPATLPGGRPSPFGPRN
ncbi:hypothetical protein [uncultured Desulfovibrio sp.]|uniref:hypothetical protein n=1 Tax=uncultured Desulfovibrio sp. TaxID=167968 RepID=UPI002636CFD4|nr:hypothetical protein [uncultured Desulfovibrio sp.]